MGKAGSAAAAETLLADRAAATSSSTADGEGNLGCVMRGPDSCDVAAMASSSTMAGADGAIADDAVGGCPDSAMVNSQISANGSCQTATVMDASQGDTTGNCQAATMIDASPSDREAPGGD